MITHVYSVYDLKSRVYSAPFCQINREVALRNVGLMIGNPNTDIGRFPQDHVLYELGTFDDSTGKFDLKSPPEFHIECIQLVPQS